MMKRVLKTVIIGVIVASLTMGVYTQAASLADSINQWMKSLTMRYDKKELETDAIIYQNKTYIPLEEAAQLFNKKITKKNTQLVIEDQKQEIFQLRDDFLLHGFYAISSYDQFDQLAKGRTLSHFDTLSFGWARIDLTKSGTKLVLNGRDFYIPSGYDDTIERVAGSQIPTTLMVFADDNGNDYFPEIFRNEDRLIKDIVALVNGKNKAYKNLSFSGVTIDFENVNKEDQVAFVQFLTKLRKALGDKKVMQVAIPSVKYYGYYHYKDIAAVADYMIMMEHDFNTRATSSPYYLFSKSPLSPIKVIEQDMKTLVEKIGKKNSKKIILQVNFASSQWVGKDKGIYKRNTKSPTYSRIYDRIYTEISKMKDKNKELPELLHYNETYANPYLTYTNDKGEDHFIWFENWSSVLAKIKLANDNDLGGISLWRIGTVPNYYGKYGKEAGLDIWYQLSTLFDDK